ncbi:MAG: thermonuclease family protein [Zoogloeaceae bacterium]|jgi:endonuclease YncB( thermonuclease family)|nr:thermonuclease family protein [Zoogloeaceae bacterium]
MRRKRRSTKPGILVTLALLLLYSILEWTGTPNELAGYVVGVADGDTLTLLTPDRKRVRIRLAEIDAPEKAQPFGQRSKRALSDICLNKQARVTVRDIDRYGRSVGLVLCDGDKDANATMVSSGLAWVYAQYSASSALRRLEDVARREKRGLWADHDPLPPWEWRKQRRQ